MQQKMIDEIILHLEISEKTYKDLADFYIKQDGIGGDVPEIGSFLYEVYKSCHSHCVMHRRRIQEIAKKYGVNDAAI